MSHLHIPDGVLPVWLWLSGWIVAVIWVALVCILGRRRWDLRRKVPLVGISAALMVIAMTLEIAPLDYHLNLSVITGIILGPFLAPLAALITEVFLALVGHGGVTVIGLNTLILSIEMILGWALFKGLRVVFGAVIHKGSARTAASAAVATVLALICATSLTVGVVALATPALSAERIAHESGATQARQAASDDADQLSLTTFIAVIYTLGPFGWAIEAGVTSVALVYLDRLRPGLVAGSRRRERGDGSGGVTAGMRQEGA